MSEDQVCPSPTSSNSSSTSSTAASATSTSSTSTSSSSSSSSSSSAPEYTKLPKVKCKIAGNVPAIKFGDPALSTFIQNEVPVIIQNCPVVGSAIKKWSLDYLAKTMSPTNKFDVYSSTCNKFRYSDDSKNAGGYEYTSTKEKHSMTFTDFLKARHSAKSSSPHLYHYLQQTLYEGVPAQIVQDVKEFAWDWIYGLQLQHSNKFLRLKSNVIWIGEAGVVTPAHYDEAHNFFAQVSGKKRFLLFAPDAYTSFYPFPLHHPCDRQSQVDLYEPDLDKFPRFVEAKALEANLEKGDVLFLPAFWWHHVECITDNSSINFWFEAQKADVSKLSFPLTGAHLVAVRRNIERMIGQVIMPKDIGTFCEELAANRFKYV